MGPGLYKTEKANGDLTSTLVLCFLTVCVMWVSSSLYQVPYHGGLYLELWARINLFFFNLSTFITATEKERIYTILSFLWFVKIFMVRMESSSSSSFLNHNTSSPTHRDKVWLWRRWLWCLHSDDLKIRPHLQKDQVPVLSQQAWSRLRPWLPVLLAHWGSISFYEGL